MSKIQTKGYAYEVDFVFAKFQQSIVVTSAETKNLGKTQCSDFMNCDFGANGSFGHPLSESANSDPFPGQFY